MEIIDRNVHIIRLLLKLGLFIAMEGVVSANSVVDIALHNDNTSRYSMKELECGFNIKLHVK